MSDLGLSPSRSASPLLVGGDDTIVALATAAGRSALAVLRLSGPDAFTIAEALSSAPLPPARVMTLRRLSRRLPDGAVEPLDQCLLTIFPGPDSYTGEDMVELSLHGGHFIHAAVSAALIEAGARVAQPGEFTRRALLNGKMDLLQAESVADLVDARSRGGVRAALHQMGGTLTAAVEGLRSRVLDLEALIAYDIDFPEEDDGPIPRSRIVEGCDSALQEMRGLLSTSSLGELLREGALIAIAGAPNAGKSSLFNAMLGSARALVSDQPGTTRDAIEALAEADGFTLRLVDTAGLREAGDVVERMGIEVAEDYVGRAHAVIVCGETPQLLQQALSQVDRLTDAPLLPVLTKADLRAGTNGVRQAEPGELVSESDQIGGGSARFHLVSARTGSGVRELLGAISELLQRIHGAPDADSPILVRARHQRALREAIAELQSFHAAILAEELPMPVAGTHLRASVTALESLIGAVGVEDVLDRVFSSFCVGK